MMTRISLVAALLLIANPQRGLCDEVFPQGSSYLNSAGVSMDAVALRFSEAGWKKGRDQGFAVALQKNTDYMYLWAAKSGGGGLPGKPLCNGHLAGPEGGKISVDGIISFAVGDLEGSGSTYLIALDQEGKRVTAWKLDACEGKAIFPPAASTQLPVGGRARGTYRILVTGDFADVGSDEVELIADGVAEMSEWRFTSNKFELVTSGPLFEAPGSRRELSGIRYVTTTLRLAHGADNVAHETATAILHDRGYTLYRRGQPIYYAPACSAAPANCASKVLLFNLDQGFSNGLQDMERKDPAEAAAALTRMVNSLRMIPSGFKVWALVNPIQQERGATLRVLDALSAAGIPFVLDYYSSDVTNLAALKSNWLDYSPHAFDGLKGVSLALEGKPTEPDNLTFFVEKYGREFVGVRLMERLGMDIQANEDSAQSMVPDRALGKEKLSFDWDLATRLMKWSKDNGRYVIWADPALYIPYECYWTRDVAARAIARRDRYVEQQRKLAGEDPYLIPMYDNNEGLKRCGVAKNGGQMTPRNFRLTGWERIPRSIAEGKTGKELLTGHNGFGISVQSWTTDYDPLLSAGTLPRQEMAIWVLDALSKGAAIVEFEPYFYFFDWPSDARVPQSLPIPGGKSVGDARNSFQELFQDVMGH
jgi:hypothetical protein